MLTKDLMNGRDFDRLLNRRQHSQRAIGTYYIQALELLHFAATEELDDAGILALLKDQQRPNALVRRRLIQIDENDIGILVIDHSHNSRAVVELDNINPVTTQLFGQVLPEYKVLIHQEAQRIR